MIGIYKITNNINGKVYVGQSKCIERRWCRHRNASFNPNGDEYDKPLYRAIRKNGLENFSFEVIEECLIDELDNKEKYWIQYYNSCNPNFGYNLVEGGHIPPPSKKLTEKDVFSIMNLLKNTQKSQKEIGQLFGVSQREVSGINLGQIWIMPNVQYPIRVLIQDRKSYCENCGKEITYGSVLCRKCYGEKQRVVERPSREELKKLIRTTSFLELGRRFGVSDAAIKKWCKAYSLPHLKGEIKKYTDEEWKKI